MVLRSMRHRIATLVAAAVLALPAGAWAQSAGDEQYADPFAPEPEQSSQEDEPAGGEPSGGAGSEPEPEPAAPAQTAQTQTAQAQPAQAELPRTGADTGWLALSGVVLLGGGIALRVRLSEPARRRR
jgi:LPXTG-motif cell wall-anchored protein